MFTMDHFFGSFEFETEIGQDDKGFFARAHGLEARHPFSSDQALNDLNQKVDEAISKGEIVPTMGG
jgi:hypothetical protein